MGVAVGERVGVFVGGTGVSVAVKSTMRWRECWVALGVRGVKWRNGRMRWNAERQALRWSEGVNGIWVMVESCSFAVLAEPCQLE